MQNDLVQPACNAGKMDGDDFFVFVFLPFWQDFEVGTIIEG